MERIVNVASGLPSRQTVFLALALAALLATALMSWVLVAPVAAQVAPSPIGYVTAVIADGDDTVTWSDPDSCRTEYNIYLAHTPRQNHAKTSRTHLGSVASGSTEATVAIPDSTDRSKVEVFCGEYDFDSDDGAYFPDPDENELIASINVSMGSRTGIRVGTYSSAPLTALSISSGTLSPAFDRGISTYAVEVPGNVHVVTLSPTVLTGYATDFIKDLRSMVTICDSFGSTCNHLYWAEGESTPTTPMSDADAEAEGFQVNLDRGENRIGIGVQQGRADLATYMLTVTVQNSPAVGRPNVDGTARVGQTLVADTSRISDIDGLSNVSFRYQWLTSRGTEISGARNERYTLVEADEGKHIKVRVTFVDDAGYEETLTSVSTDAVVAANAATGKPTISGRVQVGKTLTVDTSGIADGDGLDNVSYSYQWLADDANIRGATGPTYTLVAADVRKAIKSRVSFTDDAGNQESITSEPTEEVPGLWGGTVTVGSDPAGSGAVGYSAFATGMGSISSADFVADGTSLTVDVVAYSHEGLHLALSQELSIPFTLHLDARTFDSPSASTSVGAEAYIYTWDHPGLNWTEGDTVSVTIMQGTPTSPQSTSVNSRSIGAPAITGTAQVGEVLEADTSGIADADGLTNVSYAYHWLADDVDIGNATGSSYMPVEADEGKVIKVRVSFSDDAGNPETLTSAATAAVAAAPEPEPTPLTATIHDAPDSHDGSAVFTFELRLSEAPKKPFSYRTLRDDAFTVTGGEVTKARRLEQGKNIRWEITVAPDDDGNVTIVLPPTTDCAATGAICAADGRKLSNRLERTVAGP